MKKNNFEKSSKKINESAKDAPLIIFVVIILVIIAIVFLLNKNKNTNLNNSDVGIYNDLSLQETITSNVKTLEDGSKENVSAKLKEEKTFEGLVIKDIVFKNQNNETIFTAKVENKSDKDFKASPVTIIFTDEKGTEIWQLGAYIDDTPKGSDSSISSIANSDITDVYDFTIKYKVD